jgi:hypothetical protein
MEDNKEWKKINETMNTNMALALVQFNSSLEDEEEGSSGDEEESFNKKDMSIHAGDHDLSTGDYNPNANELLSGIFDAEQSKKYEEPINFLQALWNAAGPSVGSMLTQLDLIKTKLEGEEAGVEPDFSKTNAQLIDFLIKEARKNTDECIAFINSVIVKLNKYKEGNDAEMEILQSNVQEGCPDKEAFAPNKGGGTTPASKTQGLLPRAPEASPAEGAAMETTIMMAGGYKEGAKSVSMVQGG